ncbi:hypothetical protein BDF20DRAFT_815223, partial [Mycotypha africana]|uniref:uncharacterized protein n=1 Tax=Mycotypha africana TaxID=64632 RepID=UPI002301F452
KDIKHKAAENKARLVTKIANSMGIRFSSLPVGMSRNKLNQTNYSKKFPSNKPLYAFFENLLYAESPQGKSDYHIIRHQVNDFVQAGLDQFKVALKKEKAPRGYFIDVSNVMDALFRDVLKDEVIIEFPIFYIWLKSDEQPSDISVLEEKKQPLIVPLREAAGNKDHFDMDNNSQLQTGMAQQQNIEKEDQGQTQADGNPKNTDIDPIQPSNDAEVIIDENVINEESNDAIVTEEIETKASTEVTCSTNIPNENQ